MKLTSYYGPALALPFNLLIAREYKKVLDEELYLPYELRPDAWLNEFTEATSE